jgi:hypothetical protein
MKKVSCIWIAVLLLSSGNLFAEDMRKPEPVKSLSYQIKLLIGHETIAVGDKDLKGKVLFTLNEHQEIVVLAVEADTKEMKAEIPGKSERNR